MRIVLTHAYFLHEDSKERQIMRPYPPLGLLYISAWLKRAGYTPVVVDSTFSERRRWVQEIRSERPQLVACYANLMTKVPLLELLKELRMHLPETIFVVGGPDVSYNVRNYLEAGFDFAITGEGEQSLQELVETLASGNRFPQLAGVSYLKNNMLITPSEERSKLKELAELPFPDRDAIPIGNYLSVWKEHHGMRTLNISTQRGCPYTCKWCSTAVYGQSYRRNSPQRVAEEILHLKEKYQVEALWFVDDVFTVSHKWLSALHAEFQKRQLVIPFECITRAERLNDLILTQLKEMGCFRIWIGAESGSQRVIDRMDRRVDVKIVQQMIRRTQELGMEAGTFLMVGYPGETHEDIRKTMHHLRAAQPSLVTITRAYPIKGTALYHEVEGQLELPDWVSSTDREIRLPVLYSDRYYTQAIRYLMNGWRSSRDKSPVSAIKSKVSYFLMTWNKLFR